MSKLKPELEKLLETVLFSSICIKDKYGNCDRSQEAKLFVDRQGIKQFLAQALADQRQEFIKKIEEMKKFAVKGKDIHSNYMTAGYNSAIYRIIKLLQEED